MLRKSLLRKEFGFIVLIIILCCSSASSISTTSISYQNTFYVDDDNIDGPWDGTIEHPFQYIQDAIDVASDGDAVFVYSGIYYEQLQVDKSIILQGEDKNTTIIDGEKINDVIHLTGNNTVIKGFTIQYARDGLFSDDAGIDIRGNNNLITDNIIKNNFNFGIYIQSLDSYNVIENNIFDTNHMCLKLLFTSQTVVVNNTFVNNYGGIKLEYAVSVTLNQNSIFDATYPLIFDDVYSCNVSSNYFFNCGGLNLYSSCSNVFSENHIQNNEKSGKVYS